MFTQFVSHSRYLQSLQKKYVELAEEVEGVSGLLVACEEIILELKSINCFKGADEIESTLIELKAKFSYHWAIAELSGIGQFQERGRLQTLFADLTIQVALRASWFRLAQKHPRILKVLNEHGGDVPGLFILGLGKLGGVDLNFSSDADLIGYFDPSILPIPAELGQSYICHQVLVNLTKMLGQNGKADFVWRVDWRLRPNASATTLAMSSAAALEYYFYRASPWHRLALMKARIVAGDQTAGQLFFDALTPFIWRQNLDYRALDELGEIKNKINLEHPALRAERQRRESISSDISGFNVKLGAGGIREIEFIANALQLVWGGKHYGLRTTNTLDALKELGVKGMLPTLQVAELSDAYRFMRGLENALQIMGNQQTHLVPEGDSGQIDLIELMGFETWSTLASTLNEHREVVADHFEALFAEQAAASGPPIEWPEELNESAKQIVKAWGNGFIDYGISIEVRSRLLPLARALSKALSDAPRASTTVLRLHDFFRTLPQGEQYFRLLAESPGLLNSIIPPLLYSPSMSSLLKQSPHIIDCFMHSDRLTFSVDEQHPLAFDSDYVMQAENYEVRLERIRRFVNEHLYQLYLGLLQAKLDVAKFQQHLTNLATHTLDLSMRVVAAHLNLDTIPVCVIGMGKMGVGRMAPQSDLDLIFVFDPQYASLEVATKFVSRLQTAVSTPMREGVVYDLDTRLRPSGRSGAPTVSIESFRNHHLTRARTWEHIALVSADVVGGDMRLAPAIRELKREVICKARDQHQLLGDAWKMWLRISDHRVKTVSGEEIFTKLREGGLMQAEYVAAVKILSYGPQLVEPYQQGDFYHLLMSVDERLIPEIDFWQNMQIWERVLGLEGKLIDSVPAIYRKTLYSHVGASSKKTLAARQEQAMDKVQRVSDELFATIADGFNDEDWQETAIRWR